MARKYHVNPKTGNANVCRARVSCPFGDMEKDHFVTENRREAVAWAEERNKEQFDRGVPSHKERQDRARRDKEREAEAEKEQERRERRELSARLNGGNIQAKKTDDLRRMTVIEAKEDPDTLYLEGGAVYSHPVYKKAMKGLPSHNLNRHAIERATGEIARKRGDKPFLMSNSNGVKVGVFGGIYDTEDRWGYVAALRDEIRKVSPLSEEDFEHAGASEAGVSPRELMEAHEFEIKNSQKMREVSKIKENAESDRHRSVSDYRDPAESSFIYLRRAGAHNEAKRELEKERDKLQSLIDSEAAGVHEITLERSVEHLDTAISSYKKAILANTDKYKKLKPEDPKAYRESLSRRERKQFDRNVKKDVLRLKDYRSFGQKFDDRVGAVIDRIEGFFEKK